MSSYDVIIVVTAAICAALAYLGCELFVTSNKPLPFFVVAVLFLATFGIRRHVMELTKQVEQLQAKEPVVIYHVDNAGADMVGKVTDKEIIEGRYTVDVGPYGKFLVTKEQYEAIKVGDSIPEYLKKRGN